jgi:hypothetical protein
MDPYAPPVYIPPAAAVTAGAIGAAGGLLDTDFTSAQSVLASTDAENPVNVPVGSFRLVGNNSSGVEGLDIAEVNAMLGTAERSCSAYRSTSQSIAANTWTEISMDVEGWDTSSMHESVTNPGRILAPETSRYLARAFVKFASAGDFRRGLRLLVNGAVVQQVEVNATVGADTPLEISRVLKMAGSQYVTMEAWHNSATDPLNVQAGAVNNGLQLVKQLGAGAV